MNKNIVAAVVLFGLSAGAAQANLTINGVHETASPNSIESYAITANATGLSNIFLSSLQSSFLIDGVGASMNGLLSVWQQIGSNWSLVGANDEATRTAANNANIYGVGVHDWVASDPLGGISDPGLTLNLTAGAKYLVIQSDTNNGPTSLSNEQNLVGALGQTMPIGSNFQAALWGTYDPFGAPASGLWFNNYALTITGNVTQIAVPAAVPLPAAVWLFGSALAGLGVIGRKKTEGSWAA